MSKREDEAPNLVDHLDAHRYELWLGSKLAATADYRIRPGRLVFVQTRTEPGFDGQGVAAHLVRAALDDVRTRRLGITALCPLVAAYICEHPAYADLLVVPDRRASA